MKTSKNLRVTKRKKTAPERSVQGVVMPAPKPEPVSTEPLKRMAEDMQAIWMLAETRSKCGLEAAQSLARRISFNEVQFTLMKLEQEWRSKPALEGHYLPRA